MKNKCFYQLFYCRIDIRLTSNSLHWFRNFGINQCSFYLFALRKDIMIIVIALLIIFVIFQCDLLKSNIIFYI